LANVLDRVEMADLYQMKELYSSCGKLIRRNLKMVKKDAKWLELKKKSPELAFNILEEIVEEFENMNGRQGNFFSKCSDCGNPEIFGHMRDCPNNNRSQAN
jgi:uncharacterized protein with ATP-grasp and redox domains